MVDTSPLQFKQKTRHLYEEIGDESKGNSLLAAIAYHGVCIARPALGDKVAVIGLGPIG